MMKKIIIIGCPGAGKSTFARKLRDLTGMPLYYLDMIWHKPDQTNVSTLEFDAGLQEILRTKEWIIDGNYGRTLDVRFQECDTVFLMDFPPMVCLEGAKSRIGTKREDLPWIETTLDEEFKQWILNFHEHELPSVYACIEQYKDKKEVIIFRDREEVTKYLTVQFEKTIF